MDYQTKLVRRKEYHERKYAVQTPEQAKELTTFESLEHLGYV